MHSGVVALGRKALFYFEGGQWIWPGVRIGHQVSLGPMRYAILLYMTLSVPVAAVSSAAPVRLGVSCIVTGTCETT